MAATRRLWLATSCLFAINTVAACAHKTGATGQNDAIFEVFPGVWSGRIGLKILSEPPQSFFAGFELKGQLEAGELKLINPLGSILAVLRWSPSSAVLESGQGIRQSASVDELLEQVTGASIPAAALFDWLAGRPNALGGWTADLSQRPAGRIVATRNTPSPQIELRMVLE